MSPQVDGWGKQWMNELINYWMKEKTHHTLIPSSLFQIYFQWLWFLPDSEQSIRLVQIRWVCRKSSEGYKQRDLGPCVVRVTVSCTLVLVETFRQSQPTILKSLIWEWNFPDCAKMRQLLASLRRCFLKSKHFFSSEQPPSEKISIPGEDPICPERLSVPRVWTEQQ